MASARTTIPSETTNTVVILSAVKRSRKICGCSSQKTFAERAGRKKAMHRSLGEGYPPVKIIFCGKFADYYAAL